MFVREPFVAPPGSTTSFEVRYSKGRKPFGTRQEAAVFANAERAEERWAEVNMIVSINVEPRS
jgi:poly(3-hydroxybutyrate) depolymerase